MKKLFVLAIMTALLSAFVVADVVPANITVTYGLSSVVFNCGSTNYIIDKGTNNGSQEIQCEVNVNATIINQTVVNNQTVNLTCDADAIAASVANRTGAQGLDVEAVKSYFNDRTQSILNTVKDEVGPIKSAVQDAQTCQMNLLSKQTEITTLQGQKAGCEAYINSTNAMIAERDQQHNDDRIAMIVLLGVVVFVLLIAFGNFVLGLGKQSRHILHSPSAPPQYQEGHK